MDDFIIDDCWNCRRTVHQPKKHERNPLIAPSTPALGRGMPFTSVLYDSDRGLFRLWGIAHPLAGQDIACHGVYLESADGLEWSAPSLRKVSFEGSKANNIFLSSRDRNHDSLSVIRMPAGWEGRGRYAMLYAPDRIVTEDGGPVPYGEIGEVRLAFSDDGINWQDQEENPVLGGMNGWRRRRSTDASYSKATRQIT